MSTIRRFGPSPNPSLFYTSFRPDRGSHISAQGRAQRRPGYVGRELCSPERAKQLALRQARIDRSQGAWRGVQHWQERSYEHSRPVTNILAPPAVRPWREWLLRPFRACCGWFAYPGRRSAADAAPLCPGLICCGPFGAKRLAPDLCRTTRAERSAALGRQTNRH